MQLLRIKYNCVLSNVLNMSYVVLLRFANLLLVHDQSYALAQDAIFPAMLHVYREVYVI